MYKEEKERERRDKSGRIEKRKDITTCGPKNLIVAISMSIGWIDGQRLDTLGVGEAHETPNSMS